jgi:hypothetical protein
MHSMIDGLLAHVEEELGARTLKFQMRATELPQCNLLRKYQ